METSTLSFNGYLRPNGAVGIRNKLLIIAVDECCEGIARGIAQAMGDAVVLTNWYTCMLGGNEESFHQMIAVGQNPNVAGVLVIAMGCGSILPEQIAAPIQAQGTPTATLTCQKNGGTRRSIAAGIEILLSMQAHMRKQKRQPFPVSRLVVGVKCGGSDTSSGIASNPSVGLAVDKVVEQGGTAIGGELFELIGCEKILSARAANPAVGQKLLTLIEQERQRWSVPGTEVETMSIGNSVGGLTTIEEKSLGALHKMGHQPITGVLQINKNGVERPQAAGFYLSEVTMLCGGAGVNFASLGAHLILWTSGAAGFNNAIVPVVRVSGNADLYNDDMDVDVCGIMDGTLSLEQAATKVFSAALDVASGQATALENIGDSTMTLYQKDQRLETLLGLKCL